MFNTEATHTKCERRVFALTNVYGVPIYMRISCTVAPSYIVGIDFLNAQNQEIQVPPKVTVMVMDSTKGVGSYSHSPPYPGRVFCFQLTNGFEVSHNGRLIVSGATGNMSLKNLWVNPL